VSYIDFGVKMVYSRIACFALLISALSALFCADAFQLPTSPKLSPSFSTSLYATGEPVTDRRGAMQWSGMALASILLGGEPARAADPKTILITGANSGIGFEAAKILIGEGHTLILACRTLAKSQDAIERVKEQASVFGKMIPAECNLASLESIQLFVQGLPDQKLDIVCLNAGLSLDAGDKQIQRTADGFELTGESLLTDGCNRPLFSPLLTVLSMFPIPHLSSRNKLFGSFLSKSPAVAKNRDVEW
jgi:hypothetical protein